MQYIFIAFIMMAFLGCGGGGSSSSEDSNKEPIDTKSSSCELILEYKDNSSGVSLCIDAYTKEECDGSSGEDDEVIVTAKQSSSSCSSLGYVQSLVEDDETWYYKLEDENSVLPDANFKSLGAPRVVSVATDMQDSSVLLNLVANEIATLSLINLTDQSFTMSVDTESGEKEITSYTLSSDKRVLKFTAPANVVDGTIRIKTDTTDVRYPYTVRSSSQARLLSIDKESANVLQKVTLYGKNLPSSSMTLVFENQGQSLEQTVIPSSQSVSFIVPKELQSGYLYLKQGEKETNRLYLQVSKDLKLQVQLESGVSLEPSEISFVRGAQEFTLDSAYATSMEVESQLLDYVHATVIYEDVGAILYSSVVLPQELTQVTLNAQSTAISWIFMGLFVEATSTQEDLQSLYDDVASNTKVKELAEYISSLQKDDLKAWLTLSDTQLKEKYQDALKSVLQAYTTKEALHRDLQRDTNEIIISQNPTNSNIYVDAKSYDYLTYGEKLKNGGVSIVNDTKLYMSVEIKDAKEKKIVNGYEHVDELMSMNHKSLVGPKGWGLLGMASSKTLELNGQDANIEIVVGSVVGATDNGALSVALQSRVFIDGVATPMLNMVLSTLINKRITQGHKYYAYKNIIDAMSDIYGANFFAELTTMVSNKDNGYYAIADTLILKPLTRGFNSCFQVPIGGACDQTVSGVAKLIGVNTDNAVNKIMLMVAQTAGKRVFKRSVAVVPVAGWITSTAFFVYDNIGTISDSASIAESLVDMGFNPREINVAVDFPLELHSVTPTCVGITPQSSTQNFTLKGAGFALEDGVAPQISITSSARDISMQSVSVASDAKELRATFDAQTLGGSSSWLGTLNIQHLGQKISYDTPIRLVSSQDDTLYVDSIEPQEALRGGILTLKGCGWIPLESLSVEFETTNGRKTVEPNLKSVDTIEVEVPLDAVSGLISLSTTHKTSSKWLEIKEFSLSKASKDQLVDATQFSLQGSGLAEVEHLYFRDSQGNVKEATISNVTNTGIWVSTPSGLEFGQLALYVLLKDGTKSNEIFAQKVPLPPEVSPAYGVIDDGLDISLTQEEGAQIYYMLADNTVANQKLYSAPFRLTTQELKYTKEYLYTFARVTVDGVAYDSSTLSYTYEPCVDGEDLNTNKECVVAGSSTSYSDRFNGSISKLYMLQSYNYGFRDLDVSITTQLDWSLSADNSMRVQTSESYRYDDFLDIPVHSKILTFIFPDDGSVINGDFSLTLFDSAQNGESYPYNAQEIVVQSGDMGANINSSGISFTLANGQRSGSGTFRLASDFTSSSFTLESVIGCELSGYSNDCSSSNTIEYQIIFKRE